jgi:cytochrome oxidase Cu insertion factor (SCO1/SenC/PrrC family)
VTTTSPGARRSRLGLIGLAALFFVPLALSFLLYYGTSWRPSGGTQHGELIQPPRPLPAIALAPVDGGPAQPDGLRGAWHLVFLGPADCGEPCRESLVMTRQVRLALDKDMTRVRRVYLYPGEASPAAALAAEQPDLLLASLAGPEGAGLAAVFPGDGAPSAAGEWFLVDPLGNLMMAYPADVTPKGLLKDLERLLKLSHIG